MASNTNIDDIESVLPAYSPKEPPPIYTANPPLQARHISWDLEASRPAPRINPDHRLPALTSPAWTPLGRELRVAQLQEWATGLVSSPALTYPGNRNGEEVLAASLRETRYPQAVVWNSAPPRTATRVADARRKSCRERCLGAIFLVLIIVVVALATKYGRGSEE
jgi:hypothetical protein